MKGLMAISKKDLSPLELIDFFKNEPMDFSPGEAYKYSNSGYIILEYIIESLSGMFYSDFVEEKIFKKIDEATSIEHGGSIFGFKSMGIYIPSENLYVIGLNNCDGNSPTKITRETAGLFLKALNKTQISEIRF